MNVEVTDLETLLEKWTKMRSKEAEKVTFYINHNEEEDYYEISCTSDLLIRV